MGCVLDLANARSRRVPFPIGNGGLKQQRRADRFEADRFEAEHLEADHLEAGALVFRCPMTQHDFESGVEMDRRTFLRIGKLNLRLRCPACRHFHEFKVAHGSLAPFVVSIATSASNSPAATEAGDRQKVNR
jgi:hypothetical protein